MKKNYDSQTDFLPRPKNAIEAFEQIYYRCENSHINGEFLISAELPLNYVKEKFDIDSVQAVMLSIILEKGTASTKEMANHLDISNIRMYSLIDSLDNLSMKKIIWRREDFRFGEKELTYGITTQAMSAIIKDETFSPQSLRCNNWEEFFSMLDDLYSKRDDGMLSAAEHENGINDLCEANPDLDVVKKINKWSNVLSKNDKQLLIFFCMIFVKRGDADVEPFDFSFIFDNRSAFRRTCTELSNQTNMLFKKGLVEIANNQGVAMRNSYRLSDKAKKEFFPMLVKKSPRNASHLHSYKEIDRKELFYNDEDQLQISTLFHLMEGNHLKQVQSRLAASGMRTGVCCLLYGGPGTGKTATVLEIARSCKRDIFQVNLSELRSKWVGESEQLCQKLWDDYNALVAKSKRAPILLLNECDGILTSRMSGATQSVDKMENTIANIFLENMEKQKGIVLATTNLATNLDPAFERRFIYKIRLGKPCLKARQSIWKTMLPTIADSDAEIIAKEYEFSGGQIENIARKSMIDYVLDGEGLTLERLRRYCQQENIKSGGEGKALGFGK